jgi:hypothetical protein
MPGSILPHAHQREIYFSFGGHFIVHLFHYGGGQMVSSYQFSQRFDGLSVLATCLGALWALLRTLLAVAGLAVCLGGVFAVVVAFWLPICQVVGCLAIIAAFAYVTYPRTPVRP